MIRSHEYTVYVVRCNYCGIQNRSVADGFGTPEQALAEAAKNGWDLNIINGQHRDLCPACLTEPCS